MWDRLRKDIAAQRELIRREFTLFGDLIDSASREPPPDRIATAAMAAVLISFYGGIENIFRRTAKLLDDYVPSGPRSHRDLLDQMVLSRENRPALIRSDTHEVLLRFMRFRHVFHHIYMSQLDAARVHPLARQAREALALLERDLDAFLKAEP